MFHSHLKHQARQKEHKDLAMAALIFLLRLIVIPPPHTTAVVIRIVCLHVREQFLDLPIAASPCLYIASTISRAAVKPILASHLIPFPFCIRRSLWDFEGPQTRNPPCIYFEVFLRDFIESCSDLLKPFVIFFHQVLVILLRVPRPVFFLSPLSTCFPEARVLSAQWHDFESVKVRIPRLDEFHFSFLFRWEWIICGESILPAIGK